MYFWLHKHTSFNLNLQVFTEIGQSGTSNVSSFCVIENTIMIQ
jgi:hypothetical protein